MTAGRLCNSGLVQAQLGKMHFDRLTAYRRPAVDAEPVIAALKQQDIQGLVTEDAKHAS